MKIQNIKNLLERFKNITPPNASVRRAVVSSVKKEANLLIGEKEISFNSKNGTVYIKKEGHLKNTLFIKKERIIKETNKELGKELVKDLR